MNLTSADSHKLLDAMHELYATTDARVLPRVAVAVLAKVIHADAAAFNLIHRDNTVEIVHNAPWLENELSRRTWALEKYIDQHPLENFFRETGRSDPVRISDFLPRQKFHNLALYQEFYKPLGVEYQISVFLRKIDEFRIGLGVQRQRRDFTERDKAMISLLALHIFQAYRNAREFTRTRSELHELKRALDAHHHGVIRVSRAGKVTSITSWCAATLARYCDASVSTTRRLPENIRAWMRRQQELGPRSLRAPLKISRGDAHLEIRMSEDRDETVLLLSERRAASADDLLPLGLAKRETEVLYWMAQGKSNAEIAIITGISPRTADKHTQHIFTKLGVNSRHAAMLLVFEFLSEVLDVAL